MLYSKTVKFSPRLFAFDIDDLFCINVGLLYKVMAGKEFKTNVKGYHITFDSHVREWGAFFFIGSCPTR